jgi:uncharacterized membrane protein YdjX (TVP38/TMEM64 family)
VRMPWPHLSLGWRRLLFAVLVVILMALVLTSASVHAGLVRVLGRLEHFAMGRPGLAAILVVLFSALAADLAFISSWLVVPLAVVTWGPPEALVLVWGGWVAGGAVTYAIGRWFGPPVARWLGFSPLLARYEDQVSHRTPFVVAVLFQLALPSEVRGYLFGLGRYAFGRYLLSYALAELPFGIATVFLGEGLLQRRAALVVVMGLALLAMATWSAQILHRRLAAPIGGVSTVVPPDASDTPVLNS